VSPPNAAEPQPENLVEHSPAILKIGCDAETVSNTSEITADEVPSPSGEPTVGEPDLNQSSSTDNELLERAIGHRRLRAPARSQALRYRRRRQCAGATTRPDARSSVR
jgi:hypothetical protein